MKEANASSTSTERIYIHGQRGFHGGVAISRTQPVILARLVLLLGKCFERVLYVVLTLLHYRLFLFLQLCSRMNQTAWLKFCDEIDQALLPAAKLKRRIVSMSDALANILRFFYSKVRLAYFWEVLLHSAALSIQHVHVVLESTRTCLCIRGRFMYWY